MNTGFCPIARVLLVLFLVGPGAAARADYPSYPLPEGVSSRDLPRFIQLADGIFRGGQPNERGFAALRKLGIKTVISFREGKDERARVESLGMKYFRMPLSAMRGIPDQSIRRFFELVRDRGNHPVFFHCRRGADRTGAMAAFYRIGLQGWDGRAAAREARAIGMRWWYCNLRKQIEAFDPSRY